MYENRKDEDSDDDALELSPTKSQLTENSDAADGRNDQLSGMYILHKSN